MGSDLEEVSKNLDDTTIEVKDLNRQDSSTLIDQFDEFYLFHSLTMINKDAMKNESVIANADMMRYEVENMDF